MTTNGIIIEPSNPARALAEYRDRIDRMFGDQLEPRACAGCGAETLPENLNRAGECSKCGPADPKPVFETLEQTMTRLARKPSKPAARVRCSRPHHPLVHCHCRKAR